jgi:Protein of unknown function (DUF2786)
MGAAGPNRRFHPWVVDRDQGADLRASETGGKIAFEEVSLPTPEPTPHGLAAPLVGAMDRAQASRRVAKLRALGADRAATEAEKALARAKADELSARYRLEAAEEARPRPQSRHRTRRVWVESPDLDWIFDAKVEHHWGDWKIAIEIGWRD